MNFKFFRKKQKYIPKLTILRQQGFSWLHAEPSMRREWYDVLTSIRGTIFWDILFRVTFFTLVATAFCLLEYFGFVESSFNSDMHTIVGGALGLMLVYRSNTAYERYWEARSKWEDLENVCCNLMMIVRCREKNLTPKKMEELANMILAFVFSIKQQLRGVYHPEEYTFLLSHQQSRLVDEQKFKALTINVMIADWIIENCEYIESSDSLLASVESHIETMIESLGSLERISNTPVPFSYVAHLHHILLGYLVTLPAFLITNYGWYAIPCTFFIAFSLLGVDQSATEIESPFGMQTNDLPLDSIAKTIQEKLIFLSTRKDLDMELLQIKIDAAELNQ